MLALVSLGVVMVYSASAIMAADRFHDPLYFLKKQLFWAVLGVCALWAGMLFDYRRLERFVVPLLAVSFVLLVLVLVPPFGQEINGTRRWFRAGPVSFQPVELAKFSLLLYLAAFLTRRREVIETLQPGPAAAPPRGGRHGGADHAPARHGQRHGARDPDAGPGLSGRRARLSHGTDRRPRRCR